MVDSPLLEGCNLGKRRPDGDGWLLRDVGLQLPAGQRLAIEGPTGGGKTLCLRALTLLDPLDCGQVLWRGRDVVAGDIPAFRSRVIYLHQRAWLSTDMTVEENLRRPFFLRVHRHRRFNRNRVVELLEQLGRDEGFLAKSPGDLSGGERQIAALVRALQLAPAVLLLDEPTAALDRQTTEAVEALLHDWINDSNEPRAWIWVSHEPEQTRRVADRVLRMQFGRLQENA